MNINSPIFVPMGLVSPAVQQSMYVVYDVPQMTVVSASSVISSHHQQQHHQQNFYHQSNYRGVHKSQQQNFQQQRSRYFHQYGVSQVYPNSSGLLPMAVQNNGAYQFIHSQQFFKSPMQLQQKKRPLITKEEVEYVLRLQRKYKSSKNHTDDADNHHLHQLQQPQMLVDEELNDTLQRDGSKASHLAQRKDDIERSDNKTDGSLTMKCQKQKSAKNVQKQKNQKAQNSYVGDQKKTRRADDKEFDTLLTKKLNGIRDMDFASNGEYFASGTEESIIKRHNPKHRNSSASDVASTSDDVNSVSSREDLSDTYDLVKVNKKNARARRNRKQRRQQQQQQQQQHQQQQQRQQPQQQKKQTRGSPNSSNSGTSSPTPSIDSQQDNFTKTAHNNGKDSSTARPKQKQQKQHQPQQPLKTAKEFRLNVQPSDTLPSSSSTSPSTSAANSVSSSPTASPKAKRIGKIRHMFESPFGLVDILSEFEIAHYLRQYIPDAKKLRNFGYPVESTVYEGCIEIYKSVPRFFPPRASHTRHHHHHHHIGLVNSTDGLKSFKSPNRKLSSGDSGKGSGTSTPLSYNGSPADSDYSEEENATDMVYSQIVEKSCVRCKKPFKVTTDGEYITREPCNYHWGKQEAGEYMDEKGDSTSITFFSCCKKVPPEPCTQNHVHVWTDITSGLNGPYTDFVHTEPRRYQNSADTNAPAKIYALDCEMSYTGFGMEVTKVTVIAYNGKLVYESIVHPRSEVGDYNTRFSGVSEKDFEPGSDARTLETVQNDLLDLIDADDILIGHALENDLRSLRIVHKRIVDTAIIFPHPNGFPFRRGLKSIVAAELGREIQIDEAGHSSLEDSQACLELMLLKVRAEWRSKSTKKAKSDPQSIVPKSEQFVVLADQQAAALTQQKA